MSCSPIGSPDRVCPAAMTSTGRPRCDSCPAGAGRGDAWDISGGLQLSDCGSFLLLQCPFSESEQFYTDSHAWTGSQSPLPGPLPLSPQTERPRTSTHPPPDPGSVSLSRVMYAFF